MYLDVSKMVFLNLLCDDVFGKPFGVTFATPEVMGTPRVKSHDVRERKIRKWTRANGATNLIPVPLPDGGVAVQDVERPVSERRLTVCGPDGLQFGGVE
jgi:hypothetical protein